MTSESSTATPRESPPSDDASVAQLIMQLSEQSSRLVRDELKLAQAEIKETVKHSAVGAGLFSTSGLLALYGLGVLIATAIIALDLALPLWAAALIVAAVLFLAAGTAALLGKKQVDQASPIPQRTVENVKRDLDEVKERRHDNSPK